MDEIKNGFNKVVGLNSVNGLGAELRVIRALLFCIIVLALPLRLVSDAGFTSMLLTGQSGFVDICNRMFVHEIRGQNMYHYVELVLWAFIVMIQATMPIILWLKENAKLEHIKSEFLRTEIISRVQKGSFSNNTILKEELEMNTLSKYVAKANSSDNGAKTLLLSTQDSKSFRDGIFEINSGQSSKKFCLILIYLFRIVRTGLIYFGIMKIFNIPLESPLDMFVWFLSMGDTNYDERPGVFTTHTQCDLNYDYFKGSSKGSWVLTTIRIQTSRPKTFVMYVCLNSLMAFLFIDLCTNFYKLLMMTVTDYEELVLADFLQKDSKF